jgi:putative membrane protein
MLGFIIRAAIVALGLWLATQFVPGVSVASWKSLVFAAVVLGLINAIVRPLLVLLTLPVTLVTLGLFLLVINGLMVLLMTMFIHGFVVHGLLAAILVSLVVSITGWIASWFIGREGPARR